jgi:transposase
MSNKELTRLDIMKRLSEKHLKQKKAAQMLGISERHLRRLLRNYRREGTGTLLSRRRGQASNNRLSMEIKQAVIDLLHSRYSDFGPTLAHEKLTEGHALKISRESVRQMMIAEGLWKPRKVKRPPVHQMRPRRACRGELIQIDGSPHAWFEERGPVCSLLVYIDDATGELMELYFAPAETTFSYFAATRRYLARHGRPVALYSDKHGIFRVNTKNALSGTGLTQFGRAMKEIDIDIICANTPQAKGRVERAICTLQDRLVKELRLRNISSIEAANHFAPAFMQDFNRRFAVQPRSSHDAHRPQLFSKTQLDHIFSHQETRSLSKNLTLQYNKTIYQIRSTRPSYALRKARVTVCETPEGLLYILYKGSALDYEIFRQQPRQAEVLSSKDIETHLKSAHKPAADHPWRKYGKRLNGTPIQHKNASP